jgi:hypothetical protein
MTTGVARIYRASGLVKEARLLLRHALHQQLSLPFSTSTAVAAAAHDAEADVRIGVVAATAQPPSAPTSSSHATQATPLDDVKSPVAAAFPARSTSDVDTQRVDLQGCVCDGGQYFTFKHPQMERLLSSAADCAPLPTPTANVRIGGVSRAHCVLCAAFLRRPSCGV